MEEVTPQASAGSVKSLSQKRIQVVFLIFTVVTVIILARISYLATFSSAQRQTLLEQSRIGETLLIPGQRGSIIAPDGTVIAYSERRLDIYWQVPFNYNVAENAWRDLSDVGFLTLPSFEQLEFLPGTSVVIAHDLRIDDKAAWNLIFSNPQLKPRVFFKRVTSNAPEWRNIIGNTVVDSATGIEIGVSGIEKLYDESLRPRKIICRFLRGQKRLLLDGKGADGTNVVLQEEIP